MIYKYDVCVLKAQRSGVQPSYEILNEICLHLYVPLPVSEDRYTQRQEQEVRVVSNQRQSNRKNGNTS